MNGISRASDSPVSVFTEFQPLEEMIVGSPYPADAFELLEDVELRSMMKQVMQETEEDCEGLSEILRKEGVTVRRPEVTFDVMRERGGEVDFTQIDLFKWRFTYPNPPLWPRDLTLAVGNRLLSVYSRSASRWLEGWGFYAIFADYFRSGAQWVSMPPPILNMKNKSYEPYEDGTLLFHAANFLKCGRDIFHSLPAKRVDGGKGTELGLEWIKRELGENYRFHAAPVRGHLDGKIALIKPGLLISWLDRDQLPEPLQSWDMIRLQSKGQLPEKFVQMRGNRYYKDFIKTWLTEWIGNVDETYFDVNLISVNENLLVTNGHNPELAAQLKKYGVDCIPFNFRHRYFWDGGLHCITLDIRRRGGCEDYFG